MRILAAAVLIAFVAAPDAAGKGKAFRSTKHGDVAKGPKRRGDQPAGSCLQCHDGHASHDAGSSGRRQSGLFAENDVELCFTCHALPPLEETSFPDLSTWSQSAHAEKPMTRPSTGTRRASDNRCVTCHNPHGVRDKQGVVPAMLHERESDLCLGCHDGARGADIRSELMKPHVHAAQARGAHVPGESAPLDMTAQQGHASCSDCHNSHVARRDRTTPLAPEASARLAGVSRVQVINGPAGSQPAYRWISPSDPAPPIEFEICFKCHSSAAKQRPQREDIARTTNPANPSFHPIQAAGANRRIDPSAFANGYNVDSRVRCTDCHSSDSPRIAGPHGSTHEHLLRVPLEQLCYQCHSAAVYAGTTSDTSILKASRFNAPAEGGHALHASQKVACSACHEAHGSMRHPALIGAGGGRGIVSYTQTPQGGTCNTTCHASRTYKVNYPR